MPPKLHICCKFFHLDYTINYHRLQAIHHKTHQQNKQKKKNQTTCKLWHIPNQIMLAISIPFVCNFSFVSELLSIFNCLVYFSGDLIILFAQFAPFSRNNDNNHDQKKKKCIKFQKILTQIYQVFVSIINP